MLDLLKFAKFAPLLNRKLDSLSTDEVREIGQAIGLKVTVTEELKDAALALLKGKSLDTVADMIQHPESIQQLVLFMKGGIQSVAEAEIENHPDYAGVSQLTLSIIPTSA